MNTNIIINIQHPTSNIYINAGIDHGRERGYSISRKRKAQQHVDKQRETETANVADVDRRHRPEEKEVMPGKQRGPEREVGRKGLGDTLLSRRFSRGAFHFASAAFAFVCLTCRGRLRTRRGPGWGPTR